MPGESDILGGLFGAATSAATGNPIGMAAALGGIGLSIFGASEKADMAKQQAALQSQMTATEMQQDAVRQQAMRVNARRQQIEVLRNAQRARSLALNNATSQGAQFGSGLQGGYGQISGAAGWNNTGIQSSLDFGEQMFGLNQTLSQQKMQMANLTGQQATNQAYTQLGSTLVSNANQLGNIGKQFGLGK